MADSSFDPLALVKAMGPQRDPYSWAEMYAQDAAKGEQLIKELRNRMLIHESDQKSREREGAANRGSRERLVDFQQRQMNERAKVAAKARAAAAGQRAKDVDWPEGSMSEQEGITKGILDTSGNFDRGKYVLRTRYGITKLVPKEHANMPMSQYPELAPAPVVVPNPTVPRDGFED
jgi:hypothetical protein